MHKLAYLLIAVSSFSSSVNAKGVLLTGKIKAGEVQNFTVPWSQNWRQQIKWLKPEGESVDKGDLVVLFDTANLDSQIEQQEVNLRQTKEKAKEQILNLEQRVIDAEHNLIGAELDFELADVSAKVPNRYRSNYEADNLDFELKKAESLLKQAKRDLKSALDALAAEKKKQSIEVKQIAVELDKFRKQLELLQLKADRKGTVLHAMHPWDGSKISEGQSVQTSWDVASIPGSGGEWVESWVNEVDWHKLSVGQKVSLTLDSYPNQHFQGEITKVSQQAEKRREWGSAAYYQIRIDILKLPEHSIVPGMSVRIEASEKNSDNLAYNEVSN